MKQFSPSAILLSTILIVACAACQTLEAGESAQELQYWNSPNVDHVLPSVAADDDDLEFRDIPQLEKGFIGAAPADRKDGLVVGRLGIDGGNKDMIVKLAQEIADGHHGKYDSLLIAYKGKLLFESYYLIGRLNLTHPQASATKTYTSLALGRAIQLGYLTMADLDKPLVSFFKELDPVKFVEGAERLTLHQALTMRSGIRISKEQREEFDKDLDQINGQRLVQAILEQSAPVTSESQNSFSYGNYSSPLVMQVIDAVVPGTAEDFIKNELLGKMGITTYSWQSGLGGLPAGGWGASITSRAMIKIGILAMSKGKWNGEQLIPEAFITKATSRILYNGDDDIFGGGKDISNQGYGYFWWNADMKVGDKSYFSSSAQGGGGQYIVLIKELDLMVVVTGHDSDNKTLQMTAERILPAFTQNSVSTLYEKSDDQDELPVLKGDYFGQKPPGLIPEVFAPGVVSIDGRFEGTVSFSSELTEMYFSAKDEEAAIYFSRLEDDKWTPIERADFTKGRKNEEMHPFVSPDGERIYFTAMDSAFTDEKIWYVNRLGDSWSDAILLDSPVNDDLVFFANQAKNGDLYYFNLSKIKTYYAPNINGEFPEVREVALESGHHAFISPSQDYLILTAQNDEEDGRTDNDMYVYFKEKNGAWTKPINLGSTLNTRFDEKAPTITPDGKYLFFGRAERDGKIGLANNYWVSTEAIENLRPK